MSKSLVVFIGILNILWAIFMIYILLSFHPEKWYLKGLVLLYPFILFYSFKSKFINRFSDGIAHKLSMIIYGVSMIFAVFFIFN